MTRALAKAHSGDLFGYWEIVKPIMFGRPTTREDWPKDGPSAAHLASFEPPWCHGITSDYVATVPTLVDAGGWNTEYEAIAARLGEAGARTAVLSGRRHRVQDHPDFNPLVAKFLAAAA